MTDTDRAGPEAAGPGHATSRRSIAVVAAAVIAYGVAMAFLEASVVVYLRAAYDLAVDDVFPLRAWSEADPFVVVEVGREAATILMIAVVGWLAGRSGIERLAWAAVVFGTWDIGYYAWLAVLSGWPPSLTTWDLLFLVPVPWVGPVWAPVVVSVALVVTGLAGAARLRGGGRLHIRAWQVAAAVAGGLLVILSFTIDAAEILAGGMPRSFAWPLFAAGMIAATAPAAAAFRRPYAASSGSSGRNVNA